MDEIGHFLLKQYVYGILANSNAVSTDIIYYYEKLMQRSYNQMDNNEVVLHHDHSHMLYSIEML